MTRIEIGMKKGDEVDDGTHSPKKAGVIDFSHPMQDFIQKVRFVRDSQMTADELTYVDHSI